MHHLLDAFASSAARRVVLTVQGTYRARVRPETIRPDALSKRHMGARRSGLRYCDARVPISHGPAAAVLCGASRRAATRRLPRWLNVASDTRTQRACRVAACHGQS
jgi:hypothetical protein